MEQRSARQTLEAFFAAFKAQDVALMEALLAPDFVIYEAEGLPYGGAYKGFAGWMDLLGKIGATWTELTPTVRHLIGDGPHFAVLMELALTSRITGRRIDTSIFEQWTVESGRIKEVRPFYWDTKSVAALVV
jgi:ketosteroid isomerase-like protein